MYQLCRVYPPCYLCERALYSLALGSHIVKFLTILLVPLRDLRVVECVLLSVCLTVLLGNSARAYPWAIRAVDRDESRRKQNTYNRLLCAVPGVPDRWEARSILLLLDYSLTLPTTHSTTPPHALPYHTTILHC